MNLLGKIFVQLASPLGLCFALVLLGLLLMLARRRKTGVGAITLGLAWLFLWSLPVASIWLRQTLEQQTPLRPATDYPAADAIVVLGGGVQGARSGWRTDPHLQSRADRAWFGARLFRAGRAPVVILSGGNSVWSSADQPEAEAMETFEHDLGVPASALLREDRSRNTEENAQYTQQLMAEHHFSKILLVTSAVHMPRALALFRAQGIDTIPAPTDFDAIPSQAALQDWLPDSEALFLSSKAMKEHIAIAIYRLKELMR